MRQGGRGWSNVIKLVFCSSYISKVLLVKMPVSAPAALLAMASLGEMPAKRNILICCWGTQGRQCIKCRYCCRGHFHQQNFAIVNSPVMSFILLEFKFVVVYHLQPKSNVFIWNLPKWSNLRRHNFRVKTFTN